ncbi:unnamed protein product [Penicillium manginii]
MEKLTRLTFCEFEAEFKNHHVNARNSRPERLVKEAHKNVIISDPDYWNGAGIETIRAHFAEYLRAAGEYKYIGTSRFGGCLVIDERSLKSIIATTDSFNERGERQWGNVGFVGMVDGRYEQGIKYDIPSYKGFMRVRSMTGEMGWRTMRREMFVVRSLQTSGSGTGLDDGWYKFRDELTLKAAGGIETLY